MAKEYEQKTQKSKRAILDQEAERLRVEVHANIATRKEEIVKREEKNAW